jgi:hypothetical protein
MFSALLALVHAEVALHSRCAAAAVFQGRPLHAWSINWSILSVCHGWLEILAAGTWHGMASLECMRHLLSERSERSAAICVHSAGVLLAVTAARVATCTKDASMQPGNWSVTSRM